MQDEGLNFMAKGTKKMKVEGMPRLSVLKLNGLISMNDITVINMADVFTSIEALELNRCESLT